MRGCNVAKMVVFVREQELVSFKRRGKNRSLFCREYVCFLSNRGSLVRRQTTRSLSPFSLLFPFCSSSSCCASVSSVVLFRARDRHCYRKCFTSRPLLLRDLCLFRLSRAALFCFLLLFFSLCSLLIV